MEQRRLGAGTLLSVYQIAYVLKPHQTHSVPSILGSRCPTASVMFCSAPRLKEIPDSSINKQLVPNNLIAWSLADVAVFTLKIFKYSVALRNLLQCPGAPRCRIGETQRQTIDQESWLSPSVLPTYYQSERWQACWSQIFISYVYCQGSF